MLDEIILPQLGKRNVGRYEDSEIITLPNNKIAFTTDSFVVDPIFFPGGDIGKLSICGTVNDLICRGAYPLYIAFSLILEEGFNIDQLSTIVKSACNAAEEADVYIVVGDTKVLPKGKLDKICINTSGIGAIQTNIDISVYNAKVDDDIIISGTMGDHALSVVSLREGLGFERAVSSDCAPLNGLLREIIEPKYEVHCIKDPTRGGLITALNEIAINSNVGVLVQRELIPISRHVKAGCEMLGLDPLYLANEGKLIIMSPSYSTTHIMSRLRLHPYGKYAAIIGRIVSEHPKCVLVEESNGIRKNAPMLAGVQKPRLC